MHVGPEIRRNRPREVRQYKGYKAANNGALLRRPRGNWPVISDWKLPLPLETGQEEEKEEEEDENKGKKKKEEEDPVKLASDLAL